MNSNVARDEVRLLDLDLREIYKDYGSQDLYVIKFGDSGEYDEVYDEYIKPSYSEPYKVMGMVTFITEPKSNTGLGEKENINKYTVRVLKSSLDEQEVLDINTNDKIQYLGNTLDIQSVKQDSVVGDYFLQYKIQATSSKQKGFKSFE